MNNPEDQNPMLPNLRDECLSGMNSVVKGIFIGFAICVAAIIAWFFFLVTRPAKVVEEHATHWPQWTDTNLEPADLSSFYVTNSNLFVITNTSELLYEMTQAEFRIFDPDNEPWLSASVPDNNNWHWTNVVFSSTREPVVTKTNGEWRIGFK